MTSPELRFTEDDQPLLDRLVDGELNDRQRRDLLMRLEQYPDGWRRCALAFLEAQSWRDGLGDLVADVTANSAERTSASAVDSSRPGRQVVWLRGPFGTLLAMAASFLLALGLGLLWNGAGHKAPGFDPQVPLADGSQSAPSPTGAAAPEGQIQWRTMPVSVPGGPDGAFEEVQVPVAAGPQVGPQWLMEQPWSLPPEAQQALERAGHRVRQNRYLYPVQLQDGGQIVVPIDQVEVHFVGQRDYQ